MKINLRAGLLLAPFILICVPAAPPGQMQEMSPLTSAVARAIKIEEAEWSYTPGHCTCPPLISPQESANLGFWERKDKNGQREQLMIEIYQIPSTQQAIDWMKGYTEYADKRTCRREKNQFGDESSLLDCSAEKFDSDKKLIGGPIQLWFRKDNFLVSVNGNSQDTVVRFAKYASRELPSN